MSNHARRRRLALLAIATTVALASPAEAGAQQVANTNPPRTDGFTLQAGEQDDAATLTLEEAIGIARRNNPDYLAQRNDDGVADWTVRQSYASFLPTATASMSGQYQAPGVPNFGLFTSSDIGISRTPPYYFSSYRLGLNLSLSPATFFEVKRARAARKATDASIDAESFRLASNVTVAYLTALRARDGVELAQRQLEEAEETRDLAQSRVDVGEAIPLDAKQAQVGFGRAQVALLQARNLEESQLRRLAQQLGVQLPDTVALTSEFQVFEPTWSVEDLVAQAMPSHPDLVSLRAGATAAKAALRQQQGTYLPTLNVSAAWSGFTRETGDDAYLLASARDNAANRIDNCEFLNQVSAGLSQPLPDHPQDCSRFQLSAADEQEILDANRVFPFDFQRQPLVVSATVSLPIFTGFNRQLQVAQARNQAEDADYQRRAAELRVRADIGERLGSVEAAWEVYQIEQENYAVAQSQVELARERYRLGAGTFLELLNAQAIQATADRDLLSSRYTFHEQLVALEAAVGRSLRPAEARR